MEKILNKLIYGVGINDADYPVTPKVKGKAIWCPFYRKWNDMLKRCYSEKFHRDFPAYEGCYVADEWLSFLNFKVWMESQDWQDKVLDKDILQKGNKIYSKETCVFVDKKINSFILENQASRGVLPIGVRKKVNGYQAQAKNDGKTIYLGNFETADEAHQAWVSFKLGLAIELALNQSDLKVTNALIKRYENYGQL